MSNELNSKQSGASQNQKMFQETITQEICETNFIFYVKWPKNAVESVS